MQQSVRWRLGWRYPHHTLAETDLRNGSKLWLYRMHHLPIFEEAPSNNALITSRRVDEMPSIGVPSQ